VPRFQRQQTAEGGSRSSPLELFYDLVFVFAVTQVSHYLLDHQTWTGAGEAAVMLLAVWWSWNYTTWATNELDTSSPVVRVLIIALMLGSLLMSVAIPEAWGDRALLFAGAYVALNLIRQSFLTFAAGERGSLHRLRASRILIWFCASGVLWIAGALAEDSARTLLWLGALVVDYSGPLVVYRVPGLRRVSHTDWEVAVRALRRALPALRDHRARRVDRADRRDHLRPAARRRHDGRLRRRLPRQRGALVALLQPGRGRLAADAQAGREPDDPRP